MLPGVLQQRLSWAVARQLAPAAAAAVTTATAASPPPSSLSPAVAAAAAAHSSSISRRWFAAGAGAGGGGAVQEVASVADYEAIMQRLADAGSLGIIDFTAKWCGPCKAIAPIYEQLAAQYPDVAFLKIDIDNADVAPVVTDHNISAVPTFAVYSGRTRVESFTGARVDLLRAVLAKRAAPP